jgi:Kelch motif
MPGSWQPLANQPAFNASTMLLLTDGTVMAQESNGTAWWRLTPDEWGDYANGTWSPLAPMIDARLYYASAVLADGRVFVAGGEYNGGSVGVDWNRVEVYDPVANSWQPASTPGWTHIGDAPCCVLPDGRVLLGSIDDTRTAIYDPKTGTWSPGADKADSSSEEGFTLMPDDTVLAPENSNPPYAEKYLISAGTWVSAGQTPVSLVETSVSIEIGPCLLRPDGTAFQVGANGHTAVYRPDPDPATPGTWTAGPDFPDSSPGTPLKANDAPGCVLPNGHVLCVAGTAPNTSGYAQDGQFFEFDGKLLDPAPAPANAGGFVYDGRMLVVPTGQVLFSAGSPAIEIYTPVGEADDEWRPRITEHPRDLRPGHSYVIHGERFNGMTQAVAYGDDATMATNYPIIRLISEDARVHYCRTFDHATMAVATGHRRVHTRFTVPAGLAPGRYDLRVVANGIASREVEVRVS